MAFAALSGFPEIGIPLVLAAETAYLGLLGTHPKFQAYVNAQEHKETVMQASAQNRQIMDRILRSLPETSLHRYERLRYRCQELKQIAADLKTPNEVNTNLDFESSQIQNLDRLLWVFLRLLFTQHSLDRFLEMVSVDSLNQERQRLSGQLTDLNEQANTAHGAKLQRTLEDSLKTIDERIANIERAQENSRYVALELDRLENKIISLAEMAVNRQDPNYISGQVDAVVRSVRETEKTMSDLQFITGLGPVDEVAPELMQQPIYIRE